MKALIDRLEEYSDNLDRLLAGKLYKDIKTETESMLKYLKHNINMRKGMEDRHEVFGGKRNQHGHRGLSYLPGKSKPWKSTIQHNGTIFQSTHETKEAAIAWYLDAVKKCRNGSM